MHTIRGRAENLHQADVVRRPTIERARRIVDTGPIIPLAAAAMALVGAYQRRWMSDDGWITLRVVRQLLHGNGPVFNVGERVEASTSTAWTYLLALIAEVTRQSLWAVAVYTGMVLASAAAACMVVAARRLHGPGGAVPLGILIWLALPPVWDFATAGLEGGLMFFWIAGTGVLLATAARPRRGHSRPLGLGRLCGLGVAVGMGPLIRPDLLAPMAVLLVAAIRSLGLGRKQVCVLLASALALPMAYEVFRMAYYGVLVPNTALAKEASDLRIERGLRYLVDFVSPYALPFLLLLALPLVFAAERRTDRHGDVHGDNAASTRIIRRAFVGAGVVEAAYVVAVGGDFMHARLLLPALQLVLLPYAVVPWSPRHNTTQEVAIQGRRAALRAWVRFRLGAFQTKVALAISLCVLTLACGVCAVTLRVGYGGLDDSRVFSDERRFYAEATGSAHPVSPDTWVSDPVYQDLRGFVDDAGGGNADPRRGLLTIIRNGEHQQSFSLPAGTPTTIAMANIGIAGWILPDDTRIVDRHGLADPLGARVSIVTVGRAGHEKVLTDAYVIAEVGAVPAPSSTEADLRRISAARQVLACGRLRQLDRAVRAPLDWGQVRRNITGSVALTRLRVDADPLVAANSCP